MKIVSSLAAVAGLGATLLACSSSSNSNGAAQVAAGNCPSVGATDGCANDGPATQDDVDQCNKAKSDSKCGAKYTDYLKCAGQNLKCGADGRADSAAIAQACSSQSSAYQSCLLGGTTDGGTD